MNIVLKNLKGDFLKMKNTPFYYIHIFIPILWAILFLAIDFFFRKNHQEDELMYIVEVIVVFPILIGIVTSMVIDKEAEAGRFKEMLGGIYIKQVSLISKILMLLICGFISTVMAIGIFFVGFNLVFQQSTLPVDFYGKIILVTFGSEIFLYLFHIGLSFIWGTGASIGAGIFECLICCLMDSALGDGIWYILPCGWSIRFCKYFSINPTNMKQALSDIPELGLGVNNCILFTAIFVLILFIWFNFFEGRKEN